jgi:hypothetical protein
MAAKRRVRQLTILLAVAAVLVTGPGPAGAVVPASGAAGPATGQRDRGVTVTLPTGDEAILRQEPGDRRSVRVHAAKGAGRAPTFQIVTVRGDIHVFPSDVRHLVGRLLDPELFNVSGLVRMGYADAKAATLPMIVQHAGTARRPAGVTAASRSSTTSASALNRA